MTAESHWVRWHAGYDDPASGLSRRLAIVQARVGRALDDAPAGPIRLISMCAGEGRDTLDVLAAHPRRRDVTARLVELDPELVARARRAVAELGLTDVEIVEGDASTTSAYAGAVPANLILVCGVFGNVSDADVQGTVRELPRLSAAGATVIWTRHRLPPDLTPVIRGWFGEAGFDELAFDTGAGSMFGVGTHRFAGSPLDFQPGRRMFTFFGDGAEAQR